MDAKVEVTNLITPILNSFETINNEIKYLLDLGLREYLESQTSKYYYTNTFLSRNEKVKFYDIYYPIKCKYRLLTTDFINTNEIFEEYKYITLLGSAGSGKTTLIKYIYLSSILNKSKIPVLIELRHLNDYNDNLEKLILEKVVKTNLQPSNNHFSRALKSGKFLFLFDGYDEITSSKKQSINKQIEFFIDSFSENWYVISTRPGGGIENFPRFHDFHLQGLDNDDIIKFTTKIVNDSERRGRILKTISDPSNKDITSFLRNPLLLSMFILAYESHPEIPRRKSAFYKNVFDTLYSKHDAITKFSFPREKKSKLEREDFEKILNCFSFISQTEGIYSFTDEYLRSKLTQIKQFTGLSYNNDDLIYDLRTQISILVLDGFQYSYPHRSLQEFFTAQFIKDLPSNQKSNAYSRICNFISNKSFDNSGNLFSLMSELDRIDFVKEVLLKRLMMYKELFETKNDAELTYAYIEIAKLTILTLYLAVDEVNDLGDDDIFINSADMLIDNLEDIRKSSTLFHKIGTEENFKLKFQLHITDGLFKEIVNFLSLDRAKKIELDFLLKNELNHYIKNSSITREEIIYFPLRNIHKFDKIFEVFLPINSLIELKDEINLIIKNLELEIQTKNISYDDIFQ
ncbi:energy-coupling factor transporter ATP-binding protein EcfA2 [Spirosoma lacussanchae]|uniref:NACHT domain-containing protein n=1 Tax=Spirosoma lacussanchae TaxID=1884249 RepID=UPI0011093D09|nr:NACHT domain-containing protein [Spirosoma lacussanchae]